MQIRPQIPCEAVRGRRETATYDRTNNRQELGGVRLTRAIGRAGLPLNLRGIITAASRHYSHLRLKSAI
jgi:hypothetical protein